MWVVAELPNVIELLPPSIDIAWLSPFDSTLKFTSTPASLNIIESVSPSIKSNILTPPTVKFISSLLNTIFVSLSP